MGELNGNSTSNRDFYGSDSPGSAALIQQERLNLGSGSKPIPGLISQGGPGKTQGWDISPVRYPGICPNQQAHTASTGQSSSKVSWTLLQATLGNGGDGKGRKKVKSGRKIKLGNKDAQQLFGGKKTTHNLPVTATAISSHTHAPAQG